MTIDTACRFAGVNRDEFLAALNGKLPMPRPSFTLPVLQHAHY